MSEPFEGTGALRLPELLLRSASATSCSLLEFIAIDWLFEIMGRCTFDGSSNGSKLTILPYEGTNVILSPSCMLDYTGWRL